jgi:hypothetical protein
MTASLKTYLARLSRILGVNEATLYERQRALVREGLLESRPGQGRGSGVRATPDALAMLLLSFMSSISLTDAAPLTASSAKAKAVRGTCPLTGAPNLREAMRKILATPDLLDQVDSFRVTGLRATAEIKYGENEVSVFEGRPPEKEGTQFSVILKLNELRGFERLVTEMFASTD